MARWHLFEFEDQAWFPETLRNYMTDFIRHATIQLGLHHPIASRLGPFLAQTGQSRIIDLCSGAGGLLVAIHPLIQRGVRHEIEIYFTDKYPNHQALADLCTQPSFHFLADSIDATRLPSGLSGARTLFSAFHHFKPAMARLILKDAMETQSPIAIFEVSRRSPLGLLHMLLSPLAVLLTTPTIRPFRWSRLVFTYLIPALPVFILWDGLVSALRTYKPAELRALLTGMEDQTYSWTIGEEKATFGYVITYMLGTPFPPEDDSIAMD